MIVVNFHVSAMRPLTYSTVQLTVKKSTKGETLGLAILNCTTQPTWPQVDAPLTTVRRMIIAELNYLLQDAQCRYNRTGILCGSCPDGKSSVLATSECKDCSSLWLFLVIPFAVAGLLLVFVVHYLNLTVTMGTVSGLIFYANVIQDFSVSLLSVHPVPGLTPVLQVFLAWLNLDFGISTCFYRGMGAFGKTILQGVFPIIHLGDISHHHCLEQPLHLHHQTYGQ